MTTNKAIELIKIDVEHYRKLIIKIGESRDQFFKKNDLDESSPGSMQDMSGRIMQSIYEMLNSLYKDQIKYYEDILSELKLKKSAKLANLT